MAYDLTRFSPQSFERFIQAMASAIAGEKVQVFGAGRDGAREATSEGKILYLDQDFDGYTVFQAKFLARSSGTEADLSWVKRQIDLEMRKFASVDRALRRPEFYVLATNTRLTAGAADKDGRLGGSIDKASQYLAEKAQEVGILRTHLWHEDTISSLLDAFPNLRQSFAFWVQPSDVLHSIVESLKAPDQKDTMLRYMRRTIQQSRDIKTRDAGQALSRTIGVSDVFVDLPIKVEQASSLINRRAIASEAYEDLFEDYYEAEDVDLDARRLSAAYAIVDRASDQFNANVYCKSDQEELARNNKILVLGGPGQGKSTISQFVAQVYRASLLCLASSRNSQEVNQIVVNTQSRMAAEGIKDSLSFRLPFQVDLPRYADEISRLKDGENLSVFAYVAKLISALTDSKIDSSLLQKWLGDAPSIFILDGLDEVPASGGREQTIDGIKQLTDFITELNLDAIVFVTSRPQGYQDELSRKHWEYWTLEDLELPEAMSIVSALAPVMIPDQIRQQEVVDLLSAAGQDEATLALMTSPLQVSLLFSLVAAHNNIPKDRWTLFFKHYDNLRDREIAKGGATGRLIGEYKSQIDRLHYDAGFILHVRAETTGAANPFFTKNEFQQLVSDRLRDDGFDENLAETAKAIARISYNRLVFLRSGVEGQIAFDVRSLQEFMAAARLTLSPESKVIDRLAMVVGKSHWLHVVKIAASRIYGSIGIEALRDPFLALLDSLNNGDVSYEAKVTKAGSRIALELLTDGAALTVPIYRRRIYVRAMQLLRLPHQSAPYALARLIDKSTRSVVDEETKSQIIDSGKTTKVNHLRMFIVNNNDHPSCEPWFREQIEQVIATPSVDYTTVVNESYLIPSNGILKAWFQESQLSDKFQKALSWYSFSMDETSDFYACIKDVPLVRHTRGLSSARLYVQDTEGEFARSNVDLTYRSIAPSFSLSKEVEWSGDSWKAAYWLEAFQKDPSFDTLANFFETRLDNPGGPLAMGLPVPWIITAISWLPANIVTREKIENGDYGDPQRWREAEERWSSDGVSMNDLSITAVDENWLRTCSKIGAPPAIGRRLDQHGINALPTIMSAININEPDSWLVRTALMLMRQVGSAGFQDLLLRLDPKQTITKRALLSALLDAPHDGPLSEPIVQKVVRLTDEMDVIPLIRRKAVISVVEAIEEGPHSLELIRLVTRYAFSNAGRSDKPGFLNRVSQALTDREVPKSVEAEAMLIKLQTKTTEIDIDDTVNLLKNHQEFHGEVLKYLGRASSNENQRLVAKKLATWLLAIEDNEQQGVALHALMNDLDREASCLSCAQTLERLSLPSMAVAINT